MYIESVDALQNYLSTLYLPNTFVNNQIKFNKCHFKTRDLIV